MILFSRFVLFIIPLILLHHWWGSGEGLLGQSGIPLAVWLQERIQCKEDWSFCGFLLYMFGLDLGFRNIFIVFIWFVVVLVVWSKNCDQDVVVHECAPKFAQHLFHQYLGHLYKVHHVSDPVLDLHLVAFCGVRTCILIVIIFNYLYGVRSQLPCSQNTCCPATPNLRQPQISICCFRNTSLGGLNTVHVATRSWLWLVPVT